MQTWKKTHGIKGFWVVWLTICSIIPNISLHQAWILDILSAKSMAEVSECLMSQGMRSHVASLILETTLLQAKASPAEGCPQLTARHVLSPLTHHHVSLCNALPSLFLFLFRRTHLILAPGATSQHFAKTGNGWEVRITLSRSLRVTFVNGVLHYKAFPNYSSEF